MRSQTGLAAAILACLSATAASASSLPNIKTGAANKIPDCTTPGRMMAFIGQRNSGLDSRFTDIAVHYMRFGEELEVRWDYAFFQMMLETGNLSFRRGNGRQGDVSPTQNNFAGLGATGKGESGERFPDVASGVKAHLQHVLMYAGERIDEPVAERTRKVQEWGVLTAWQKGFRRPITFADLGQKWAPGSGGYVRDIEAIGKAFYDDFCGKADPRPELVAQARKARGSAVAVAAADAGRTSPAPVADAQRLTGSELARQALDRARTEGDGTRSALGASAKPAAPERESQPALATASAAAFGLNILNAPKPEAATEPAPTPDPRNERAPQVQQTAAATSAKAPVQQPVAKAPSPKAQAGSKCRVFTASYGGQKSVIIKSSSDSHVNYTVLDVNDGQEAREIEAYVAAYARGGQKVGEFANQNLALDKAFQLCPEG